MISTRPTHILLGLTLLVGLMLPAGCVAPEDEQAGDFEAAGSHSSPTTWVADNGNGTYSNPLFFEEFSDPDVIRVDSTYYLTGTTMHSMPGLPVLMSKDLVNWELASYAFDRLDLDPSFRLEGGEQYGQGIWAPVIRHHDGMFYIFSNVNNFGTQVYRSASPYGPWEHNTIGTTLYDLSVLFDDDGKVYAVHRADDGVILEELNADITDVVPGTRRVLMPRNTLGEGYKLYRIDGRYVLLSAIPGGHTPMVGVTAPTLDGPWAYDTLVAGAHLGVHTGNALRVRGQGTGEPTFEAVAQDPNTGGGLTLHQGAIVDTPEGEWWSIIMQDHRSLGRVSALVPVTWQDGFPYLGLPDNLRRPPRVWVKPDTGHEQEPKPLFVRADDFDGGDLNPIWQWNHVPVDSAWSVTEAEGVLRLHSLPAPDLWWAKNTLTQRSVGPVSTATVAVDVGGMEPGDVAGLALMNWPYAWIGLVRSEDGLVVREYDQLTGEVTEVPVTGTRFWLRADCDFETEVADLHYSTDGERFQPLGDTFTMVYQLRTFQGIRYSLFHFNTGGSAGGHVDFDDFDVYEPRNRGLTQPIPYGRVIALASLADGGVPVARDDGVVVVAKGDPAAASPEAGFRVEDMGLGRVALQAADGRYVSVDADGNVSLADTEPGPGETFQWVDMISGDIMLMSLENHRYLLARPGEALVGNHPGPAPDHRDGSGFLWSDVG